MNRTFECAKFELRHMLRSAAIFLTIYLIFYVGMVATVCSVTNMHDKGVNYNLFACAVIYIFVALSEMSASFFNQLLMFGNTRRNIITASLSSAAIFALMLMVFSILSDYVNLALAHIFKFKSYVFVYFLYTQDITKVTDAIDPLPLILWYFSLLLMLAFFALFYGTFIYKFGKKARMVFWIGASFLISVCGMLCAIPAVGRFFLNTAKMFFAVGSQSHMPLASLHFIITAAVLGAITYVIIRRQPQVA